MDKWPTKIQKNGRCRMIVSTVDVVGMEDGDQLILLYLVFFLLIKNQGSLDRLVKIKIDFRTISICF